MILFYLFLWVSKKPSRLFLSKNFESLDKEDIKSFLVDFFLLDIEVFDLVGFLILGNHVQELSQAVLLQVFLGQVLEVSLAEGDGGID